MWYDNWIVLVGVTVHQPCPSVNSGKISGVRAQGLRKVQVRYFEYREIERLRFEVE
jgi:hypothetical protein